MDEGTQLAYLMIRVGGTIKFTQILERPPDRTLGGKEK